MKLQWGSQWSKLPIFLKFLITAVLGVIIVLNVQPWISIGYGIGEEITTIPLIDSISSLPIIGGLIGGFVDNLLRWFLFNRGDLISLIVWGIVQYLQLLHLFFDGALWVSIGAYILEFIVTNFKYEIYGTGFEDFIRDFGFWSLSLWNWIQLVIMIVSMTGVEIGLGTCWNMWEFSKK